MLLDGFEDDGDEEAEGIFVNGGLSSFPAVEAAGGVGQSVVDPGQFGLV
jgi:hypothetical protein